MEVKIMTIFEQQEKTKSYVEFTIMIIFDSLHVNPSLSQIPPLASPFTLLQVYNLYWKVYIMHGL
jgi:hypothetical protein